MSLTPPAVRSAAQLDLDLRGNAWSVRTAGPRTGLASGSAWSAAARSPQPARRARPPSNSMRSSAGRAERGSRNRRHSLPRSSDQRPRLRPRSPSCVRPVRRPRRLHPVRGRARCGGGPRNAQPLLRALLRGRHPLWGNGREVHRRCGHGCLGRPYGARGRRGAGGPGRARSGGCCAVARTGDPGPGRNPDRRGGGHARRDQPGNGRRRPGEHRLQAPVRGRPRHRPRRRSDTAGLDRRHRLRRSG